MIGDKLTDVAARDEVKFIVVGVLWLLVNGATTDVLIAFGTTALVETREIAAIVSVKVLLECDRSLLDRASLRRWISNA